METLDASDVGRCVRCGLCLSACPTYRLSGHEGYSPRGRIALARQLGRETARLSPVVGELLNTCLGCRACEAACPSGVPFGRIIEGARATMLPAGGPLRRLAERLVLWMVARRWRLSVASLPLWAAQRMGLGRLGPLRGLPRLRLASLAARMSTNYVPPGGVKERGQVVLFVGCVQDAWDRDVLWSAIHVLTHAGYRVRVPHGQVCCGALHAHAGRLAAARRLARANLAPLERFEGPIVTASAGCGAKLKEYGDLLEGEARAIAVANRVRDVSEVLRPEDVAGGRPPPGLRRVAVHDPCHLAFVQKVHSQPRALLRAAGYEVVDLPDGGQCCGAAGLYALFHRDWALPLRKGKLEAIRSVRPDAVAVANPGCLFWMASAPAAPPMYHPVQLLAMSLVS